MSARFDDWPCPIARTTDLVGDRWTALVLREMFSGRRRFDAIQESLGIPRAVLTQRLERLVAEAMVTKVAYEERPLRYEYRLTQKGREFWGVLAAMWRWGEDWLWDDAGPQVVLKDRETGRIVHPVVVDEETGKPLDVRTLRIGLPSRSCDFLMARPLGHGSRETGRDAPERVAGRSGPVRRRTG